MSGEEEQASPSDAPFGYTFEAPMASTGAHQPPGPPLLDIRESDILQNFFDNPNNVDPTFLTSPETFQGDLRGLYTGNEFDWIGGTDTSTQLSGAHVSMPPNPRSISQPDMRQVNASRLFQNQQGLGTEDDAFHYQNQFGRQRQGTQFGGFQAFNDPSDGNIQNFGNTNGYGYPPITSAASGPYQFPTSYQNGLYPNIPNPYGSTEEQLVYAQDFQAPANTFDASGRSVPSLRFGSDENFRRAAYQGPSFQAPDRELNLAIKQSLRRIPEDGNASSKSEPNSPGASKRKRLNKAQPAEAEGSDDAGTDSGSTGEDDETRSKRRRRKIKEEDEEDYKDRSGKSRRRNSTAQDKNKSKKGSESSSSKKSKQVASRPQRENLTEEQKRSNHIQSEQKRRNLIRQGFEDLNKMVPELRQGGVSKSNMLLEAAKFLRRMRDENDELKTLLETLDNG